MFIQRLVSLALVLLGAGCYTYHPLSTTPAPGERVSAQLTSEGSQELAGQIGPEVLHIEGDVVQADSAGLDLDVLEIESYRGIRSSWHGEHVRLPREALAGMQQRRLSIGGTGLLAGALTAGLVIAYQILGGNSSSEGGKGQGGGQGR